MGDVLKKRLLQQRFESPEQEAMLNLLVAAGHLRERMAALCEKHGISTGQYNVLRILRGGQPDGYPRCEIARRLIERAPDVTRLTDRLEKQGLAGRVRSTRDARLSVTRITARGLRLLDQLDDGLREIHRFLSSRLSPAETLELSRLCERLYEPEP